jgi:ribonuclease P/MRP protein subunit RPP40
MIMPEELYDLVKEKLESEDASLKYARVFMSLLDVVSGDFFNQYCKAGNILPPSHILDSMGTYELA